MGESGWGQIWPTGKLDIFQSCNYRNCGAGIKTGKQTSHSSESQPDARAWGDVTHAPESSGKGDLCCHGGKPMKKNEVGYYLTKLQRNEHSQCEKLKIKLIKNMQDSDLRWSLHCKIRLEAHKLEEGRCVGLNSIKIMTVQWRAPNRIEGRWWMKIGHFLCLQHQLEVDI